MCYEIFKFSLPIEINNIVSFQIDYPDVQLMRPGQRQSCTTMNLEKLLALEQEEVTIALDTRQRFLSEGCDDNYRQHRLQVMQLHFIAFVFSAVVLILPNPKLPTPKEKTLSVFFFFQKSVFLNFLLQTHIWIS